MTESSASKPEHVYRGWKIRITDTAVEIERKAFMSECLKVGAPAAPMTQQEKMKACNTKAGEKKDDERKVFMSECLKADKKS